MRNINKAKRDTTGGTACHSLNPEYHDRSGNSQYIRERESETAYELTPSCVSYFLLLLLTVAS